LNGAETLSIALLKVMLCPKRDAPKNRTHVRRLKNRGKPHGEAVLIFWLGELQFNMAGSDLIDRYQV